MLTIDMSLIPEGSIRKDEIDPKDIVSSIANHYVNHPCIYFSNGNAYWRDGNEYTFLNPESLTAVITKQLPKDIRMRVSSSQTKECGNRIKYDPGLQYDLNAELEKSRLYVNLENGEYSIIDKDLVDKKTNHVYDYKLKCAYRKGCKIQDAPNFLEFAKKSIGTEQILPLLIIIGCCLSSLTKLRKCFMLIGKPRSGKSTILDFLESIFTSELVSHESFNNMASERAKAHYIGKKVNICRECSRKPMKQAEGFKSLVSCEWTTGSEKHEKSIDFRSTIKFIFASNFELKFTELDDAVLDRWDVVLFNNSIPENELDPDLDKKLLAERDTIISLALDTLKDVVESGYKDFKMSQEAENYIFQRRLALHSAEDFLTEKAVLDPDGFVSTVSLYQQYMLWCSDNGIKAISPVDFQEHVLSFDKSIVKKKKGPSSNRINNYIGIRLKSAEEFFDAES